MYSIQHRLWKIQSVWDENRHTVLLKNHQTFLTHLSIFDLSNIIFCFKVSSWRFAGFFRAVRQKDDRVLGSTHSGENSYKMLSLVCCSWVTYLDWPCTYPCPTSLGWPCTYPCPTCLGWPCIRPLSNQSERMACTVHCIYCTPVLPVLAGPVYTPVLPVWAGPVYTPIPPVEADPVHCVQCTVYIPLSFLSWLALYIPLSYLSKQTLYTVYC